MKLPLCFMLLAMCWELNSELLNLLGRHPYQSLSQEKCAVNFYGKTVISTLESAQSRLAVLKGLFLYKPTVDTTQPIYTQPEWIIEGADPCPWTYGRLPFVITAEAKEIISKCARHLGILPRPLLKLPGILEKFLKRANLTSQIVDLTYSRGHLVYPDGFIAAAVDTKVENALYVMNPSLKTLEVVPEAKWGEITKAICMVPTTRFSRNLRIPSGFTANSNEIGRKFDLLHSALGAFIEKLKLSVLDITAEIKDQDYAGFPSFLSEILEFNSILQDCFTTGLSCNIWDDQIKERLDYFLEAVALNSVKVNLGFIQVAAGYCQISNTVKLQCTCIDHSVNWEKVLFDPVPVGGKVLSFDHYIQKIQPSSPADPSCLFKEGRRHFVLSVECCEQLRLVDESAINFCPSTFADNRSPFVIENQLMLLDSAERLALTTDCETSSNKDYTIGDSLKLTSCNVDLLTKIGHFIFRSFGSFNHERKMNTITIADPKPVLEIALYSVVGAALVLIFLVLLCCIMYFKPNARKNICACLRRKKILDPIQQPPEFELEPLEERSLRLKPMIAYR